METQNDLTPIGNVIPMIREAQRMSRESSASEFEIDVCKTCSGTGMEIVPGRGARMCHCREAQIRANRLAKIPVKFARHKLSTLEPNTRLHAMQAEVIPAIKANPDGSYILAGKFGCGKSLMLWMLYRHAIKQTNRKVVVCTLTELLDEFKACFTDPDRVPRLNALDLKTNDGPRAAIFLDDIDKARPTEYAAEQFFEILNAIYEYQHQLVATTNLRMSGLIDHFDRADPRYGGAIVRRLMDGPKVYEMF